MLDRPDTIAPPKKKKRWLLPFFVSFVILVIAVIITVQIVLRSTYPKTLVIAQVERALGLNVEAKSFTTGWWGHTTLRDVTISLPLADQAFLTIPELRVEHSTLPMMALKRGITLESIRAERPQLVIRQDPTGRWDLQQALELMKRTSGAKNTEEQKQPTLPALAIIDGTIHVIDNQGREATIEPVNFHGEPQNSLAWRFEVTFNDQVTVDGAALENYFNGVAPAHAPELPPLSSDAVDPQAAAAVLRTSEYLAEPVVRHPPYWGCSLSLRRSERCRPRGSGYAGSKTTLHLTFLTPAAIEAASAERRRHGRIVQARPG